MDASMRSSSKSSSVASVESSPSNTLKSGGSAMSIDILLEGKLDKIYDKVELLLDDTSLLDQLCSRASDYEEFPSLLFRFYYVHDKTHTLLRWALEKDINSLSPNELFRGETMATRLFYYQFFGDLGKRFLTSILAKLLAEFAVLDHTVEIDSGRVAPGVDTEANLKWIVQKLNEFVGRLQDSPDNCPLGLRESFLFLKDVVGNKVENSNVFIASVLFLRLICPCLVSPEEYGVLDSLGLTLTEHGKRGLIIASKILQSAANNSLWDNRPGSDKVNEFITQSNPLIVKFASHLIDAEVITLGKKVIKASVTPVSGKFIKQTHEDLRHFLAHYVLKKQLKAVVDFKQKLQVAMSYYTSPEWKLAASGPKKDGCEYSVSQMKQDGSNLFVCKYSGRFKAPFQLAKNYIREVNPEMNVDERVLSNKVLERFDDNYYDGYLSIKAVFPVGARDFVFTRKNWDESPDKWMQITYSVEREDTPTIKKFIRGHIEILLSVIERDPSDPAYTLYTYIYHVDLKGWIPAFIINGASKDNLDTVSKIADKMIKLGKPDDAKETKEKKDKKSKKEKN